MPKFLQKYLPVTTGLVVRNNKIISLPEGGYSSPSINVYDNQGRIVNEYDNVPISVVLKRTNDFILFGSFRGNFDCDVEYLDFNTGNLQVLGNGICKSFLVNNDKIYLKLYDNATQKQQNIVTDIKGNVINTNNNLAASEININNMMTMDQYLNDDSQNEDTKNIVSTENGVTFTRNLVQLDNKNISFSYAFEDSNNKNKITNLQGISAWTADNNYIYYIQSAPITKDSKDKYSTFYRYDRIKGTVESKEIYIKDCKGLHIYNGKLLFNGSGYYSYVGSSTIYNDNLFIMDSDGGNVHAFNNEKEVPLQQK